MGLQDDPHQDWVSCVRFSPSNANPIIVSAGWDKVVKVWNLTNCKLKTNHLGHTGYINAVTVSPDGSLCASGGKVPPHSSLLPPHPHPSCFNGPSSKGRFLGAPCCDG